MGMVSSEHSREAPLRNSVVVTMYLRAVQDKARPNPHRERRAGHEIPPLAEEHWQLLRCWKRKGQFSRRMQPMMR